MLIRICYPFLIFLGGALLLSQDQGAPPRENPHYNRLGCGVCHGNEGPREIAAHGSRRGYHDALCRGCHAVKPVACDFHTGLNKPSSAPGKANPFITDPSGEILCLTCHDAQLQCLTQDSEGAVENPFFLRGNPKGATARFCFACHQPEKFKVFKVHEVPVGSRETCSYCHLQNRDKEGSLRASPVATCTVCHPPGEASCRLVTCTNCHDPHGTSENQPDLLWPSDKGEEAQR